MTTPVNTDDIVQGAVEFLTTKTDLLALVGSDVPNGIPHFLFQYKLWTEIGGSESTAVVVSSDSGWAGPNLHNTLKFPRLTVEIYADPQRDAVGNATDQGDHYRRLAAVFRVIDNYLHRPEGGSQMWGTLRTVSSARLVEPTINLVADGNGLVRMVIQYAVTEG